MKTIILTFVSILFLSINSFSQITKGHWMMGGNASLDFNEQEGSQAKSTFLSISPDIGYFVIDKLALGGKSKIKGYYLYYDSEQKSTEYTFGPFVRYYFLKVDKKINIFIDSSYLYGVRHHNPESGYFGSTANVDIYKFNIMGGMSVFLNDVVSIDFSIDYSKYQEGWGDHNYKAQDIILGLGFQIFLEKK